MVARLHIGLPMWSHPGWLGQFFAPDTASGDKLKQYATVFNTVEGNTTFYAIPSEASIAAWAKAVPDDFRFCFKLPKMITHELKLTRCDETLAIFFDRLQPLKNKLGPLIIQLPPSFDGKALPVLAQFMKKLPAMFRYVVEVRHPDFFNGGPAQAELEQLLGRYRIDRLCFDSRALFASTDTGEATLDAKSKKPNLPLIDIGEARTPMVRFVGGPDIDANAEYWSHWSERVEGWLKAGREPYLFLHMADNAYAPDLARELYKQLLQVVPALPELPEWPVARQGDDGQISLF